jgi:hypothetical protein
MLDTMARQGEYSDYARVAALDPATGTPPGRGGGPHDLTQSLHHGAHNNQSSVAVPIVLSAVVPTQNGGYLRAAATGRVPRSAISAWPPLRLWGFSAWRLGGRATKAGNGRRQTSHRHPYSRSTTYLSCGMSRRRNGLSVSPFRRHPMVVQPASPVAGPIPGGRA